MVNGKAKEPKCIKMEINIKVSGTKINLMARDNFGIKMVTIISAIGLMEKLMEQVFILRPMDLLIMASGRMIYSKD